MSDTPRAGRAGTALATLALGAAVLGVCAFQVRPSEVVLVTTLGRPAQPIDQPGLHGRLPWPLQKVHRFDRRLQVVTTPLQQGLTADQQALLVEFFAAWQIDDPGRFFERLGDAAQASERVRSLLTAQGGTVLAQHQLSEVLGQVGEQSGLAVLEQELQAAVAAELQPDGIKLATVGVERVALPEVVSDQVLDRMRQERLKLAAESRAEGEREADAIRADAALQAAKLQADAKAKAVRLQGEAEAEAQASYQVFQQKPDLAIFLAELDALQALVADGQTTLILPADGPALRMLRAWGLPLKEGAR